MAAAIGLVLFFVSAIFVHLCSDKAFGPASAYLLLAGAMLTLGLLTT